VIIVSIIAGTFNFFISLYTDGLITILFILLFILIELFSLIYFLVKRDLPKAQIFVSIGLIIMLTQTIVDAGGYYGLGALYFMACFSVLYLLVDFKTGMIIPLYFFIGMTIRLLIGNFSSGSIYNNEIVVRRVIMVFAVGSSLGMISSISLELFIRQLSSMAFLNPITNLPNRYKLDNFLKDLAVKSIKGDASFSLIGIKILNFNRLRGNLGNEQGDIIISEIADRLSSAIKEDEIVAHWSHAIFMVVINTSSYTELQKILDLIHDKIKRPFTIENGQSYIQTVSAVTRYPEDTGKPDKLIENVLTLLDRQQMRPGDVFFYNKKYLEKEQSRFKMIEALNHADMNRDFHLVFQPKIRLSDKKCIGAEILLRWNCRNIGIIPPNVFIPLAEDIGIIRKITEWVVRKAFEDIYHINTLKNLSEINLMHAINLSIVDLKNSKCVEILKLHLEEFECSPELIELEITESQVLDDDPQIQTNLQKIRELGFSIAIDDFGTGYSSLSYLHKLHVHNLKIDKSFIDLIDSGGKNTETSIIDAIISMGTSLNLELTAEGVETKEQLEYLEEMGCHTVQGWYFSRELTIDKYIEFVVKNNDPDNSGFDENDVV